MLLMDISEKDLLAKMEEIARAFEATRTSGGPPSLALLRSLARLELVTERLCERIEGMRGVSGDRALWANQFSGRSED